MYKTFGIFAHVDTGKTTFSEQLLYYGATIQSRGRVDHQDAFLDLHPIERARGITVFAEQGVFSYGDDTYTMIDTPGHVDFSPEMERSIQVLDYAVLLVDAVDGVEGHTETVWQLLKKHHIPTFFFINKMDREGANLEAAIASIQQLLTPHTLLLTERLTPMHEDLIEEIAALDESLMDTYFEHGYDAQLWHETLQKLIQQRRAFPIHYGSALQDVGVASFLNDFHTLTATHYDADAPFAARVYKVRHDENGQRIAYLKIDSGTLPARTALDINGETMKVGQIRLYNGQKFDQLSVAVAGQSVGIYGLKNAVIGTTFGDTKSYEMPSLVATLRTRVEFEEDVSAKEMLPYFRMLEAEDPSLQVTWREDVQEIQLSIMGNIQLEVLAHVLLERFALRVTFERPTIIYKETIAQTVKGYGHFEPLKHYAEVHLRLTPTARNSGVTFKNECHADHLLIGQQNVIEHHIFAREHHGLLTGSALTDVEITLVTGRAHVKHTEGGDFREATHRAIRQGLEQAENILLEPYYAVHLRAHLDHLGRMMSDIQQASGTFEAPITEGDYVSLKARVPVASFLDYPTQYAAYTNGKGSIRLVFDGYDVCHNTKEVIATIGYDKNADPAYTSNSIFCSHGKGYVVPWQEAEAAMHANTEL
ncbi:elongation factor G [Kurthia massiliensis]|uniref:elongation factor G n=1 Tax=Kurthia massiliensis TaxID=1033739 RepID=UPI0002899D46|nr:TetM/TetW/TetO/TetS family tetracycline resistance ribosomal protection protein [Kurthia massiliensis]